MDVQETIAIIGTSFVLCFIIMEILSPYFSSFYSGYRALKDDHKIEWNSRVLSSIHAVISTILAIITVYFWTFPGYTVGGDQFSFNTVAITAGYISADLIMLMIYKQKIGATIDVYVHHIAVLTCCVVCLRKQYLVYFACFKLFSEASTTNVNLRWMLYSLNKKAGKLYLYNGLVLLFVFFLCRILAMPVFYYKMYQTISTDVYKAALPGIEHYVWISMSMAVDCLNIIWFRKIAMGALKYFLKTPETEQLKKD